jgi:hypothetical protein
LVEKIIEDPSLFRSEKLLESVQSAAFLFEDYTP